MTTKVENRQTLGAFYASFDGRLTVRRICAMTNECWKTLEGKRVLTVGYATPFIRFLESKHPASLTETDFETSGEKTLTLKTTETSFPFQNDTFDAIFAVIVLEHAHFPNMVLRELRRLLKTNGSLIFISANPQMPWHAVKNAPATTGFCRTGAAISHLLSENLLTVCQQKQTLFFPSAFYRNWKKAEIADTWLSFLPFFGAFTVTKAFKNPLEPATLQFTEHWKKRLPLSTADSRKSVTQTPLKK